MDAEAAVAAARRLARLEPPALGAVPAGPWGAAAVERLIPHREPFRFLDAVTEVDPGGRRIRGYLDVDGADPVFRGHFPGAPVFPGVLQLEAIGQIGLCLATLARSGAADPSANGAAVEVRAVRVHHALFLHPVPPDSRLELYAELAEMDDLLGVVAGQARVGAAVCSAAVMEVYFV